MGEQERKKETKKTEKLFLVRFRALSIQRLGQPRAVLCKTSAVVLINPQHRRTWLEQDLP
eukprot:1970018-Amphidinium_carterae.1